MRLIIFKRNRIIKITLLALCLLTIPAFFSKSGLKRTVSDRKIGAVFRDKTLGNFEPKENVVKEGPGENGKPHYPAAEKQNQVSKGMMEFGINVVASDEISMDRSIPDFRLGECKYWNYPQDLPKTSVIIVFHNEGWSPLLRTVHSVINRTPPQFLQEVLMVDDFSNKPHLREPLEDYITRFDGKVRLIRNRKREGLIRTRSYGAQQATGEIILFLDAHCEVGTNWLPPLVTPIYMNRTVMTVPVIDGIDKDHLEYSPVYRGKVHFRGIFEWGMFYKETELPEKESSKLKYHSEPYPSPTHAGGLFAMERKFFLELGGYDPGLLVWGGENFELSFKIWQCGGSILWVPCSRVGHIYRSFMPYSYGDLAANKKGPLVTINYKRVVETWMDEYKEYFYTREPMARYLDHGDISEQVAIRNRLQCKSFKWFMENVAYDVPGQYPLLPKNVVWGEAVNLATGKCIDSNGFAPPKAVSQSACHGLGSSQVLRLNAEGQMGVGERCIDADEDGVKLIYCPMGSVNGPWKYDKTKKTLHHNGLDKCIAADSESFSLKMKSCEQKSNLLKWRFEEIRSF